jgi:hypothetical protein
MKKEPSPAQIAAREKFAQAARDRAAKKKEAIKEEIQKDAVANPDPNDVSALLRRIEELEQNRPQLFQPAPVNQYRSRNIVKFSTNAKDYPDPRPRLFEEERLKMKNFTPIWWALEYKVGKVEYDRDGDHFVEPRFEIELWHVMENEEGEPSNKRYKVCTGIFFEDPDFFIQVANLKEIDIPEEVQKEFMDEMRYLVIRDWVLECFYPPKPSTKGSNRTEDVIGNRVVEVIEVNSVEPVNAFAKLSTKI